MKAFTMVELMIVVAIIAILAAIAYPSYLSQVRKQRRAQAKADLSDLTQTLERSFTTDRTYLNFVNNVFAVTPSLKQSPRTGLAYYVVTFTTSTATTYTIQAAPQGDQTHDPCLTLTINQQGVKTPLSAGSTQCW